MVGWGGRLHNQNPKIKSPVTEMLLSTFFCFVLGEGACVCVCVWRGDRWFLWDLTANSHWGKTEEVQRSEEKGINLKSWTFVHHTKQHSGVCRSHPACPLSFLIFLQFIFGPAHPCGRQYRTAGTRQLIKLSCDAARPPWKTSDSPF